MCGRHGCLVRPKDVSHCSGFWSLCVEDTGAYVVRMITLSLFWVLVIMCGRHGRLRRLNDNSLIVLGSGHYVVILRMYNVLLKHIFRDA